MPSRLNNGFTLVELLVALAIFAVVAMISYQAINASLVSREVIQTRLDQLSRINYVFNRMQQDLLQVVKRPVLDEVGNRLPGMLVESEEESAIEFTHHGRIVSIEPIHHALQRTRYVLQDNKLYRQYWDVLDRVPDTERHSQLLLDNVESIDFEFIGSGQAANTGQLSAAGNDTGIPAGLRVMLRTSSYGLITRTFVVRS